VISVKRTTHTEFRCHSRQLFIHVRQVTWRVLELLRLRDVTGLQHGGHESSKLVGLRTRQQQ